MSGPLADSNVVRNAIRKDSSLEGPLSYENIFKFVRMDIEELLVDRLQAEVKFALQVRIGIQFRCRSGCDFSILMPLRIKIPPQVLHMLENQEFIFCCSQQGQYQFTLFYISRQASSIFLTLLKFSGTKYSFSLHLIEMGTEGPAGLASTTLVYDLIYLSSSLWIGSSCNEPSD
jgi:hypothetical protein